MQIFNPFDSWCTYLPVTASLKEQPESNKVNRNRDDLFCLTKMDGKTLQDFSPSEMKQNTIANLGIDFSIKFSGLQQCVFLLTMTSVVVYSKMESLSFLPKQIVGIGVKNKSQCN